MDRGAGGDLVYATIRLLGERPESGRQAIVALARADPAVAAMIDGSPHAPPPIDPAEPGSAGGIAPARLIHRLPRSGLAAQARPSFLEHTPLVVRANPSSSSSGARPPRNQAPQTPPPPPA